MTCTVTAHTITTTGLSRAALFAATALGTAIASTDCSTNVAPGQGSIQPLYGSFPVIEDASTQQPPDLVRDAAASADGPAESSTDSAAAFDADDEAPSAVAAYGGAAPVDASRDSDESG